MAQVNYFQPPADPRHKWSVLIPTWNNLPLLKIVVASLRKNSAYQHQLIVHVNEGKDGTAEWLRSQGIAHSHTPQNVGVSYGFNMAATLATCENIVMSEDDKYFCPGWDAELMAVLNQQPDQNYCLSATTIEHKDTGNPCVIAPFYYGDTPENFEEQKLLAAYRQLPFSDWCGASWYPMLLHRNTWMAVGGMSIEYTPGMWSDPDFMIKLYHYGIRRFMGIAAARVYHFMSKTTTRIKKNDGKRMFLLKWGMSSRHFYKNVLHLGERDTAVADIPPTSRVHRIKSLLLRPENTLDTRLQP